MNFDATIVDAGSLVRLAVAGLLDNALQVTQSLVVLDVVELECSSARPDDLAHRVRRWIDQAGDAVTRVETIEGIARGVLEQRTLRSRDQLERFNRDGAVRAIRSYVESLVPEDASMLLVVHEDRRLPGLLRATQVPVHLMTTRFFLQTLQRDGFGAKVDAAAEAIANVPLTLAAAEEHLLRPPAAAAPGA